MMKPERTHTRTRLSPRCGWRDIDRLCPPCLMKDLWRSRADRQDGVLLDEALFNKVSPAGVEVAERRGERWGEVGGRHAVLSDLT